MEQTWDDLVPSDSNYIASSDIGDREVPVKIREVKQETVGQGRDQETKGVLYFEGHQKGLILNVTNRNFLKDEFGPNPAASIGQDVVLYTIQTEYGGKSTRGLRLKLPRQTAAQVTGDEIPF